jgi:VIT1/CCC1 family predicted Fe2+/Mn2+ transporter
MAFRPDRTRPSDAVRPGPAVVVDEDLRRRLLVYQRNEITEHHIYRRIARLTSLENRRVLEEMAACELEHYGVWRSYTGRDVEPNRILVFVYFALAVVLGFTFCARLFERWEQRDQRCYEELESRIPESARIQEDECGHEAALLGMLDERRVRYASSIVLGLSDALVELTGALAGLTLALQNTRLIALVGIVTGLAASLSMAASSYMSTETSAAGQNPLTASLYTGGAYVSTVIVLVMPYLLLGNAYAALGVMLAAAVSIIALFNFYLAIATDQPFRQRFAKMAVLSMGVAAISFLLGYLVRAAFGVDL